MLASDKRSSLLLKIVNYYLKTFYRISPRLCIKLKRFYSAKRHEATESLYGPTKVLHSKGRLQALPSDFNLW